MYAKRLSPGDTIGVFCPSGIADPVSYERSKFVLEHLGFKVRFGENIYKDTDGYSASARERAQDLNALVAANEVKMVLFAGGDGASEILPLIDYENIRRHPKLFCSYSDATPILLAIRAQTELVTYYGPGISSFCDLRHYNYEQFASHFFEGRRAEKFVSDSNWKTLNGGSCEGEITGGYSSLFALMLSSKHIKFENKNYILVIEDHERFSNPNTVNTYMSFIEQSAVMQNVVGLVFGHYAVDAPETLINRLRRFGENNGIPVFYTDDFGHGYKHAIFPIGASARLDADKQELEFLT